MTYQNNRNQKSQQQQPTFVQGYVKEKFMAAIHAEEDVLSCILYNPMSIQKIVDSLKPEYFFVHARNVNAVIYQAMLTLYQHDRKCTIFNVEDELDRCGKTEWIVKVTESSTLLAFLNKLLSRELTNIEDAARIVFRKYQMRQVMYITQEIAAKANNEDEDTIDEAMRLLNELALDGEVGTVVSFADAVDDYMVDLRQKRDDFIKGIERGLPTGYADLDKMVRFEPSNLYAIGALTGYGKSAFATNIALNIALGDAMNEQEKPKHLMFISLEMPIAEIVQRALSIHAEKDQTLIRKGDLDDNELSTLEIYAQRLKQCKIDLDDGSYSMNAILSNIKRVHAREPLDLIVVDYLQLIESTSSNHNNNRTQEVSEISNQLKRLAMKLKVPIVALVQLNREVEKRQEQEPKLADINESGGIARACTAVLFIWAEKEELEKRDFASQYRMNIKVAKNRNDKIGNVSLLFKPRITKFQDMVVENVEEEW